MTNVSGIESCMTASPPRTFLYAKVILIKYLVSEPTAAPWSVKSLFLTGNF